MDRTMPPAFPRQAIALSSIILVIGLVSFPSLAKIITATILVGGAIFFLQSRLLTSRPPVAQMNPMDRTAQRALAKQQAERANRAAAPPQAEAPPVRASKASPGVSVEESAASPTPGPGVASSAPPEEPMGGGRDAARAVQEQPKPREAPAPAVKAAAAAPVANGSSPPIAAAIPNGTATTAGRVAQTGGAAVLARLRQQRAQNKAAQAAVKEAQEVVVAYASQTGTAHEIAKGIQAESASHGVKSKVMSLNELTFEAVAAGKAPLLVVVASSTGEGEPPDNAAKFYATMRRRTQEAGALKGVRFTCLGLGDSNYTRYMGVSRAIRIRLQELGAEVFYKMAEADEVDGIEATVEPWIENLWPTLKEAVAADQAVADAPQATAVSQGDGLVGVPALPACRVALRWLGDAEETSGEPSGAADGPSNSELALRDPQGMYSPEQPFWASVTSARYLTASSSDRKVLHLEVDLGGSGMEYQPGDSLGVTPLNSDALVDALLQRLGASGGRRFEAVAAEEGGPAQLLPHLGCPCTLRSALQRGCDLTSVPRKSLLRLLAEHCADPNEKHQLLHLSSRGGREDYAALISPLSPSLLDLLRRYPSCQPPLASLLDALPPLAPRLYSISSSPLQHGTSAHVAFSVVRIGQPGANIASRAAQNGNGVAPSGNGKGAADVEGRWGVATGWLERQVEPLLLGAATSAPVRVPVHLRKGGSFGHPKSLAAPMVMVGPGTGVAPFRGFIQHRRNLVKRNEGEPVGQAVLYFGCRRPEEDFLYREELEAAQRDGTLSRLEVAFSRAGPEKEYVQHLMRAQGEQLWPLLLDSEAHIFVCGDGANMAKDVHAALLAILEAHGGLAAADAAAHLAAMTKEGRYIRDIWS